MALITCPDCRKDVSDLAPTCIHCGRPIAAATPGTVPIQLPKAPASPLGLDFKKPPPPEPQRKGMRRFRYVATSKPSITLRWLLLLVLVVASFVTYLKWPSIKVALEERFGDRKAPTAPARERVEP